LILHFVLNAFDVFVLQVINLSFYKLILKTLLSCNAKKEITIRQIIILEASWEKTKSYVSVNLILRNRIKLLSCESLTLFPVPSCPETQTNVI